MLKSISTNISLILLAAGESSRLGTPKQLLMYKGKNLMQHSIDMTLTLGMDTFIVLGAYGEKIQKQVKTFNTKIVENEQWNEGLSSSIRKGLEGVLNSNPDTEAVILVLCDQPFLSAVTLRQILEKYQDTGLPIVHCHYEEASGPPTLFHRSMFPYLLELKGGQGAKKVVDRFPDQVAFIDFPHGSLDIDTPEDYQQLLNIKNDHTF
jgi:molybdenum cofactor cytidylyltransferase